MIVLVGLLAVAILVVLGIRFALSSRDNPAKVALRNWWSSSAASSPATQRSPKRPTLLAFRSGSPATDQDFDPVVDAVQKHFGSALDVRRLYLEADAELAKLYGVASAPAIVLIRGGGEPLKAEGAVTFDQLKAEIEQVIAGNPPADS